MYYLDIVDQFDLINNVEVKSSEKTVVIYGVRNGQSYTYRKSYQHLKVATEVAKRVKYFIGVKKS